MKTANQGGLRLTSVDALRGLAMVLMALDHVRDFFHKGAMSFSPTDLAKTNTLLFFTRWVTHFCLPVFMFTTGMGAFFWRERNGGTKGELSRFLFTRGCWFVFLELTVMQFAYNFRFSERPLILLLILWIFGICLLAMAPLAFAPLPWLLAGGLFGIVLHNCLDSIDAAQFGRFAPLWNVLHQPGLVNLGGRSFLVTYTLLPWICVIVTGYCFGSVFNKAAGKRQRSMQAVGILCIVAFLLLRLINRYGDPAPWTSSGNGATRTLLSFLNTTKYPASLDFLLMTLGPALLLLRWFDRRPPQASNPLVIFGRVPLFYFVLHFYLIHLAAVAFALARYGNSAWSFMLNPLPSMGGPAKVFPAGFGYSLPLVYAVWIVVVVTLYPACKWYSDLRARHRDWWWLSYL